VREGKGAPHVIPGNLLKLVKKSVKFNIMDPFTEFTIKTKIPPPLVILTSVFHYFAIMKA
jgi:hypothetical protein